MRGAYFAVVSQSCWPGRVLELVEELPDRIVDICDRDVEVYGEHPLVVVEQLRRWVALCDIIEFEDMARDMAALEHACDMLGVEHLPWPLTVLEMSRNLALAPAGRRRLG